MWTYELRHGETKRLPWGRWISERIPKIDPTCIVELYEDGRFSGWSSEKYHSELLAGMVGFAVVKYLNEAEPSAIRETMYNGLSYMRTITVKVNGDG